MSDRAKNILFNVVYIVVMLRYGSDEGHHYILGVWDKKDKAKEMAEEERSGRAGKYEYVIYAHSVNDPCANTDVIGYRVDCSPEMPTLLDSTADAILADSEQFGKLYNRQERNRLYERKYQLERDLKIVTRKLNERKKP